MAHSQTSERVSDEDLHSEAGPSESFEIEQDPPSIPQSNTARYRRSWILLVLAFLVSLILAVAVVVTRERNPVRSQPSVSPPTPPPSSSFQAFTTTEELYTAVDAYLANNNPNTNVAQAFGWPIGVWDVSAIEDFERLFDATPNGVMRSNARAML